MLNIPFSYARYRTGTSLQPRLMRRVFLIANDMNLFFSDILPHAPPFLASSSPLPGIRKWLSLKVILVWKECLNLFACLAYEQSLNCLAVPLLTGEVLLFSLTLHSSQKKSKQRCENIFNNGNAKVCQTCSRCYPLLVWSHVLFVQQIIETLQCGFEGDSVTFETVDKQQNTRASYAIPCYLHVLQWTSSHLQTMHRLKELGHEIFLLFWPRIILPSTFRNLIK